MLEELPKMFAPESPCSDQRSDPQVQNMHTIQKQEFQLLIHRIATFQKTKLNPQIYLLEIRGKLERQVHSSC